jgi:hypothetical protein
VRTLKIIAGIAGVFAVAYVGIVALILREFRAHTYTIHSFPGALTNDDTALHLAQSALRLHGVDPTNYTPSTYFGGVAVGHNTLNSNRVTTSWIARSPTAPGLCVDLEQHGSDVVCFVSRSK